MTEYHVRMGGLMRCCLSTLAEAMQEATEPPKEGDTMHCKYHSDTGGMIFKNGAWEWNMPDTLFAEHGPKRRVRHEE